MFEDLAFTRQKGFCSGENFEEFATFPGPSASNESDKGEERRQETSPMLPGRQRSHERMSHTIPEVPRKTIERPHIMALLAV